jgi:hypothetical protein
MRGIARFRRRRTVPVMNSNPTYCSPSLAEHIEALIEELRTGGEPVADLHQPFTFGLVDATKQVLGDPGVPRT